MKDIYKICWQKQLSLHYITYAVIMTMTSFVDLLLCNSCMLFTFAAHCKFGDGLLFIEMSLFIDPMNWDTKPSVH